MTKVAQISDFAKPDGADLTTITMTVTPQQAIDWLEAMPAQRRLRENRVAMLERQIKEGRWKVLPHGIVFDRSGHVIDGQHRLTALARSGKSLPLRATFNADPAMFLQIDGATTPKGIEDVLRHDGVSPQLSMLMGSAVRMLFRTDRGFSPFMSDLQPTNDEAMETFRAHPHLIDACGLVLKVRVAPSRALLAFYAYQGLRIDVPITTLFFEQLATGEHLFAGDPALLLRNTWINDRMTKTKRDAADQGRMIAHALNAALAGKKLKSWRGVEFGKKGKSPVVVGK